MARVIPHADEAELASWRSRAEIDVYRVCAALADDITVIHSMATLSIGPDGSPRNGEIDFTIIDPARGILVLEVKSGDIRWDVETETWRPASRRVSAAGLTDPFQQARDRRFDLEKIIRKGRQDLGLPFATIPIYHGVLFSDLDDLSQVRRPDSVPEIIGGRHALGRFGEWVAGVFSYWGGADPGEVVPEAIEIALQTLTSRFSVRPLLGASAKRAIEIQNFWTDQQWRTFRSFNENQRVSVAGAAGSGKTLLVMRRAQELAASGKKTLLLCFNAPLGDSLKKENLDFIRAGGASEENLHTMTFHEFCSWWINVASQRTGRDFLKNAQRRFPVGSTYDVHLPMGLAAALNVVPPEYDAVLIDEGQDFADEYWLPVTMLANNRILIVCHDPNQAIFRRSSAFPTLSAKCNLYRNCRNTDTIHNAAFVHYKGPTIEPPGIRGSPLLRWSEPSLELQAKRIVREVCDLVYQEKLSREEVAVLILNSAQKQKAYEAIKKEVDLVRLPIAIETHGGVGRVVLDTVARFKGLESTAIVVWVNCPVDPTVHGSLLYVGLSRPRCVLAMAGRGEDLDAAACATR